VDVNRATVEELVAVPGIGEALARRIVEFRSKNGPFERVDDLLKVRGIGEKSLEKLRPHLRVGSGR
jgi:competence protein ComEA